MKKYCFFDGWLTLAIKISDFLTQMLIHIFFYLNNQDASKKDA